MQFRNLPRSIRQGARMVDVLFRTRVLKQRLPLFLEWNLTFRCNLRCQYCGACNAPSNELGLDEIRHSLDTLRALGAGWVTFGGGEPLLRSDIGEILCHAKSLGFQVFLSTNGSLLPRKAEVLRYVDHVNLSLDGGRETHDAVRGAGAYDQVLAAMETCQNVAMDTSLQCVLSSYNLDKTDEVLAVAREHKLHVMFQPATQWLDSSTSPNPVAPPVGPYREAIEGLIRRKQEGAPVRNSIAGLRHLSKWPSPAGIWCSAGILTCTIEPDGAMLACHQAQVGLFLRGDTAPGDAGLQFRSLVRPRGCTQCWCAPLVELALLFSLKPEPIWNALRVLL